MSGERVNLRKSHPLMFRVSLAIACIQSALALNFWGLGLLPAPTFNPYGFDKNLVGMTFAVVALAQIVTLFLSRNLRVIRAMSAVSLGWMLGWAFTNTDQVFAGDASLQLPILLTGLAVIQLLLMAEPPVNPFTKRRS